MRTKCSTGDRVNDIIGALCGDSHRAPFVRQYSIIYGLGQSPCGPREPKVALCINPTQIKICEKCVTEDGVGDTILGPWSFGVCPGVPKHQTSAYLSAHCTPLSLQKLAQDLF